MKIPAEVFTFSCCPFLDINDLFACLTVNSEWNENASTALAERRDLRLTYNQLRSFYRIGHDLMTKLEHLQVIFKGDEPLSSAGVDLGRMTSLQKVTAVLPRRYKTPKLYFSPESSPVFHLLKLAERPLQKLDLYILSAQDYFFLLERKNLLRQLRVEKLTIFFFVDRIQSWQYQDLRATMEAMMEKTYSPGLKEINWCVCVCNPKGRSSDPFAQRRTCQTLQLCLEKAEAKQQVRGKSSRKEELLPSSVHMFLHASPRVYGNLPQPRGTILSALQAQPFNKFTLWEKGLLKRKKVQQRLDATSSSKSKNKKRRQSSRPEKSPKRNSGASQPLRKRHRGFS